MPSYVPPPPPAIPVPLRYGGVVLCVFGVLIFTFALSEPIARYSLAVDGRILSSDTTCIQPYNNRCVSVYSMEAPDGSRFLYRAASHDASLPIRLPVGTVIRKEKGTFTFRRDGEVVADFPLVAYAGLATGAMAVLGVGIALYRKVPPAAQPRRAVDSLRCAALATDARR